VNREVEHHRPALLGGCGRRAWYLRRGAGEWLPGGKRRRPTRCRCELHRQGRGKGHRRRLLPGHGRWRGAAWISRHCRWRWRRGGWHRWWLAAERRQLHCLSNRPGTRRRRRWWCSRRRGREHRCRRARDGRCPRPRPKIDGRLAPGLDLAQGLRRDRRIAHDRLLGTLETTRWRHLGSLAGAAEDAVLSRVGNRLATTVAGFHPSLLVAKVGAL
jgi:hypothetical protein